MSAAAQSIFSENLYARNVFLMGGRLEGVSAAPVRGAAKELFLERRHQNILGERILYSL